MYRLLFLGFLAIFLIMLFRRKDSTVFAALMAAVLLLLVILRASTVGADTEAYLDLFLYQIAPDNRTFETGFLLWNQLWRTLGLGGRLYLAVCAICSLGFVIFAIWRRSENRVLSMTLLLVCFGWTFYLTGIRQSLAMGFFALGVLLTDALFEVRSLAEFRKRFSVKTVLGVLFLLVSPLMHNTAFFAVVVYLFVLLVRLPRKLYFILIPVSFFIALFSAFGSADVVVDRAFELIEDNVSSASRYSGYIADENAFFSGVSLYLLIKNLLPVNLLAILGLLCSERKRYTLYEHMFLWMVIVSNLFYFFSYMFRMRMFLYPMACIAVASLYLPAYKSKRLSGFLVILAVFVLISAYTTYANLMQMPEFRYAFFFR